MHFLYIRSGFVTAMRIARLVIREMVQSKFTFFHFQIYYPEDKKAVPLSSPLTAERAVSGTDTTHSEKIVKREYRDV